MTIDPVRLGFTGVGGRGARLLELCLDMDDVAVPAVCDVQERHCQRASDDVEAAGQSRPDTYEAHGAMIERDDLDGVVIATPWEHHVPMAIAAMEAGLFPALEVGPASSVEQCRDLVRTAETTDEHCMLLENCCYYRDVMAVLRMIRGGVFGEVIHCRGGYGHDIRGHINAGPDSALTREGDLNYRGVHNRRRNGDIYPTHGLGPMAKCLDINRGNRFLTLASTASKSRGLNDWAERNLDEDHPSRDVDWSMGDVITTTLSCANGETVLLTHDVALPRPYSNMFHVQGTRGLWQRKFETIGDGIEIESAIHLEDESPAHEWESFEPYQSEYEHPVWEAYLDSGIRGGHGGLDHLVLRDYVTSVRRGERPPIDVYDAATWMAIAPLSERSIALGGDTVDVPDFTDGGWLSDEPTFGTGDLHEHL
jgi:hypothetical protein